MHPAILIHGPTASGKTALAIEVARRLDGEVINADSMQLYDAVPTLTAQPDRSETQRAPHKIYGILSPAQSTDAALWRDMALQEMRRAADQGQLPIIVGGTGFYIKALTEGFSPIPDIDPIHRINAQQAFDDLGAAGLYDMLVKADPLMEGAIDRHNPMRTMRAHEVFFGTGKSIIEWQKLPLSGPPAGFRFIHIAVTPDRDWLYARCNKRFDLMLEQGAIDEVKDLYNMILKGAAPKDAAITKAIGYKELSTYIVGHSSLEEAKTAAQQATRNYTKRQMTWLRNQIKADIVFEPDKQDINDTIEKVKKVI